MDDSLELSIKLLEVVEWLLASILRSLEHIQSDSRDVLTISRNIEITSELLRKVCSRESLRLLLHIGRLEDEGQILEKQEVAAAAEEGGDTPGGGSEQEKEPPVKQISK